MAGGRKSKPAPPPPQPSRTLVLDNGAYTIKAGFVTDSSSPTVIPNCLARDRQRRTYIASELSKCKDFGEATFRRPVDKGYIVNWEAERAIWEQEFFLGGSLACDASDTRLVLTEQPNALPALQANCDQMVFEEFQFASYYRGTAAQFNAYLDLEPEGGVGGEDVDVAMGGVDEKPVVVGEAGETTEASAKEATADQSSEARTEGQSSEARKEGQSSEARKEGQSSEARTEGQSSEARAQKEEAKKPKREGPAEIRLVIDSGYSFTTVTPVLHGRPLHAAVRRLDVGGKLLTNYLTKLLSIRHYDMRHDTYIVNEIKEKACYVSLDFANDLDKTWRGTRGTGGGASADVFRNGSAGIAKEYVLPDYHRRMEGIVRDYDPAAAAARKRNPNLQSDEDILTLRNERFVVPEVLFHPTDVGLRQPGLPDVVAQSVACLPVGLWPALLANVVVVGGNAELPGFVQRLQEEIQQRMPDDLVVRVTRPADPMTCTWRGAARFAADAPPSVVSKLAVTKQEYEEHGAAWVARKFAAGLGVD